MNSMRQQNLQNKNTYIYKDENMGKGRIEKLKK